MGTPILILLAGYIFKDFKFITIDSTSTYTKDLEDDKILGISKMNLFKLAAFCIETKKPYEGVSPYFKTFAGKYKPAWKTLISHFKSTAKTRNLNSEQKQELIKLELIKNPGLLKHNVPFFTPIKLADKNMVKELRIARAFENYWANNSICIRLNSFSRAKQFSKHVSNEIARYKIWGDPNYYEAILECRDIIEKRGKYSLI